MATEQKGQIQHPKMDGVQGILLTKAMYAFWDEIQYFQAGPNDLIATYPKAGMQNCSGR